MIPTQLRRLPKSAVTPGVDLVDSEGKRVRRERSVLVLAELPHNVSRRLKDRGAQLTVVETVRYALDALTQRTFDAVIVDTLIANSTAMVKNLKNPIRFSAETLEQMLEHEKKLLAAVVGEGFEDLLKAELERANRTPEARSSNRHALTPFFMIQAGDESYAIIVRPPEHSYLEDGHGISLPDAVMTLDVGRLLLRGSALA